MHLLRVALGLLTRLPVGAPPRADGELRRASALFPLVGVAVAASGVAARAAGEWAWTPAAGTVLAVGVMVAVTGALHEDGLADTVDGLWGGADPQGRLAIMRDSRVGTYGLVSLAMVLAARVAFLAPLGLAAFAAAVACGHVLGRAAMLVLAQRLPAAAPGSGAAVVGRIDRTGNIVAAGTVALTLALTVRWWSPVLLLVGLLVTAACGRAFRRRLDGVTGDALGAANAMVEVVVEGAVATLVLRGLV